MALVYDHAGVGPQTHALIIGVGHYPYLTDGENFIPQVTVGLDELGQLSSPAHSAMAMYDALIEIDGTGNLSLPLGSIEMLISDIPESTINPKGLDFETATIANIRKAYKAWKDRCTANEDNTAIFFFCGHGVEDGEQFLLAEDFGNDTENPWRESFNFDLTRKAFNQAEVKNQLFFVDACREILPSMLEEEVSTLPLGKFDKMKSSCKHYCTIKAAAPNEGAFGEINEPSFFTKALINGLKGSVAKKHSKKWVVSTTDLVSHINQLLELESEGQGVESRCDHEIRLPSFVTTWDNPTMRILEVSSNPDPAIAHADLACLEIDGPGVHTRVPHADIWRLPLAAGFYRLKAEFAGGHYNNYSDIINIDAPLVQEIIKCL